MIICKRLDPPDDHLQKAGSSRWSFARGRILWMIICKWPDPPDDHLQEAGSSRLSFASGQILRMIICKRPDPQDDHLKEAVSSLSPLNLPYPPFSPPQSLLKSPSAQLSPFSPARLLTPLAPLTPLIPLNPDQLDLGSRLRTSLAHLVLLL